MVEPKCSRACPRRERVQDFLDRRLTAADHADFVHHLADCPDCLAEHEAVLGVQQALQRAAEVPPPALDPRPIAERLFAPPARPGRGWAWLPAGAAAAAVLLLGWWLVRPAPPAVVPAPTEVLLAPAPRPLAPVEVVARRDARELREGGFALGPDGLLAFRLGSAIELLADEAARLDWRREADGWSVHLRAGRLTARLGPLAPEHFRVVTANGTLEAVGTAFVVRLVGEATEVELHEGTLRLVGAEGRPGILHAPAAARLGAGTGPSGLTSGGALALLRAGEVFGDRPEPALTAEPPVRPAPPASEDLSEVRAALAERRLEEAVALLSHYRQHRPADEQARLLQADADRLLGRTQTAIAGYLGLAADTQDAHLAEAARFEAGGLQLESGRPRQALETFEKVRRNHPSGLLRQETAYQIAACYLALHDYSRAARALEDYLRLFPQGTKAAAARGLLEELEDKGWR